MREKEKSVNWNKLKTDTESTEDINIVIVTVFYLFKELDIEDRHIELLEMTTALSGIKMHWIGLKTLDSAEEKIVNLRT